MAVIAPWHFTLKTGETCVVRSAEERDAPVLLENTREILRSPFLVTTPDEFTQSEDAERAWIAEHRSRPGWLVLVPEVAGQVVGVLSFENGARQRLAHRGTFGLSLLAAWRGRGIGDALLGSLLGWARENPLIEKVCLGVFAGNERAIGLYRKHGFVEEGRRVREFKLGPGEYADDLLMYRLVN